MRRILLGGLIPLDRTGALRDALAGATLASMNIPQVLGYTRIAGTPVVTGLYTVLLPSVLFAIFGSSRHLVVAADSATAAIFASSLSSMAPSGSAEYMALAGIVALLTAVLLLVARIFRLGFLADFLSRTVLVGFLAGVGVQVGIAMLPDLLGVTVTTRRTLLDLLQVVDQLPMVHPKTLTLSVFVVASILACRRYLPRAPIPMVMVIGAIVASYYGNFESRGIATIGAVPGGLPSLAVPLVTWTQILALLPVAAACFVVIIAQSSAAARAFAIKHHERDDADADILGLAAANLGAGISGAFVVNGSPTQTAMADRAGAGSQLAQLVFAAIVGVVLLSLTGPLQYLPRCVLAAVVFTIAVGLIDVRGLAEIVRESPGEFALAIVTAVTVALVGVEQGILLAMALSLLRHVRHSYLPHTAVLTPDPSGRWLPSPSSPGAETEPGLIVYRFGADLFYANDARFADEVRSLVAGAPHRVTCFLVDAGAITDLDFSAARTVRDLADELKARGVRLVFARVNAFLRADMDRHGLSAALGQPNIYPTLHDALAAVRPDLSAHDRETATPRDK
jgi:high affinity sulfate transporter 1